MRRALELVGSLLLVAGVPATRPTAEKAQERKVAINPTVAAMGDNTWVKLPTPAAHPITRSSSPWMPYAPEAGVGILWGCSHAGYHNDLWTYDLAHNVWKEMLKTEPSAARDPEAIKIKDGVLMTREERPLSFHQWGLLDYDPDRKALWWAQVGGGWQGGYSHRDRQIKQEGDPEKHKRLVQKGPALWKYSLQTNKWTLVYTQDPTRCTRYGGYIRYFPPLSKLIMTPKWVSPNEQRENFKIYDPDTNTWEALKVTWKPIEENISKYWVYGHSPIVYDAKRKVLVMILGAGGTWLLDPVKKTAEQVIVTAKSLPSNLDGPVGAFVYDSVNAATLAIFADYKTYSGEKQLQARGFTTEEAHVWALDLEKKAWVLQPRPADGTLPPAHQGHMVHHFYDPVQNATVIYKGGYNSPRTETWVYRYSRAARRAPD